MALSQVIDLTDNLVQHPEASSSIIPESKPMPLTTGPWPLQISRKRKPSFSLPVVEDDKQLRDLTKDGLQDQLPLPFWGSCKPLLQSPKVFKPICSSNSPVVGVDEEMDTLSCYGLTNQERSCGRKRCSSSSTFEFEQATPSRPNNTSGLQVASAFPLPDSFQASGNKKLRKPPSTMYSSSRSSSVSSITSGSRANPVEVEPDQSGIASSIRVLYPVHRPAQSLTSSSVPRGVEVIDLSETEDAVEDENHLEGFTDADRLSDEGLEASLRNLDIQNKGQRRGSTINVDDYLPEREVQKRLRQLQLEARRASAITQAKQVLPLDSHLQGDLNLRPGKNAELRDGSFLRILSIHKDQVGNVELIGHLLIRQNFHLDSSEDNTDREGTAPANLMMPKRRNELVWLRTIDDRDHDSRSDFEKVKVCRDVKDVRRLRHIIWTNYKYPIVSSKTHPDSIRKNPSDDVNLGPLFVRQKRTKIVSDRGCTAEDSFELLTFDEADEKHRVDPAQLRLDWRGLKTVLGGSCSTTQDSMDIDCSDDKAETKQVQTYTIGDSFCCSGGFSRGADMAGLNVLWGFDMDKSAMNSYRENFAAKGTWCTQEPVDRFLDRLNDSTEVRRRHMVDILHISPPCQPFSAAHTVPNYENDEKNQAALFAVWHLIETIRPRIVTIEETEGLLSRHAEWFSALINIFNSIGYSVRWGIVRCEEYGIPQLRKRLFIIAAGPGETLPHFAAPTHGTTGNLKPLVTIADRISYIPRNATHNTTSGLGTWPKAPYSANKQAATLTCNGGSANYHPTGERNFTVREMACLQTFPFYHSFGDNCMTVARKQVGNAVPPMLAQKMLQEIVKSLKKTDGIR